MSTYDPNWVMWPTLIIYNVSILVLLSACTKSANLNELLSEKRYVLDRGQHYKLVQGVAIDAGSAVAAYGAVANTAAATALQANAVAANTPADPNAVAVAQSATQTAAATSSATTVASAIAADTANKAAANNPNTSPDVGPTSYARVAGLAGSVVLTCFIWAMGNATIYNYFVAPDKAKDMLSGVGPFVLSAASLFAPYAVNQLLSIFPQQVTHKDA